MAVIEQSTPSGLRSGQAARPEKTKLALPVILYMLAVILPVGFYVGSLYMNLIRLILLVMTVPLALKLISGRFGGILIPDVFLILYSVWMIIAMSVIEPDRAVQYAGSTVIEFIGSYVLARAYIRTPEDFIAMARLLILTILLTLPLGPPEMLTNSPPVLAFLQKIPGIRTFEIVDSPDEYRMGLYRVQAVFPHPIHYGMYCSFGVALCFVGLKGIYGTVKRYLTTAVLAFCVFMSLSSGALLPVFLQMFMVSWAWLFRWTRLRWLLLALAALAGYVAVDLLSNRPPMIAILSYITFSSWNAYWRSFIFEYGIQNVWDNPWFGLGLSADWKRPAWMYSASVDNFWLVVAMRYGIPGFVLLALGVFAALWKVGRRKFREEDPAWRLRRAWLIVMVCMALALATVDVWSSMFSFVFFFFGAGMWFLTTPAAPEEAALPSVGGQERGTTSGRRHPEVEIPDKPAPGIRYSRFAPKPRDPSA